MHISLSGDALSDLRHATVSSRVTVTLTFEVGSISDLDGNLSISGDVRDLDVKSVKGESGLNSHVEHATNELRRMSFRTSGTMS